jgi:UDP-glucose 4-epimerase
MKILIPGGAGYIGSHMVKYLQEQDIDVVVLDDFSTGHKWAINNCEIINVNLLDKCKLESLLKKRYFDGVIQFAAKSIVPESFRDPFLYYQNNVVGTVNLLEELQKNDINNFVFSSTAAIFGVPATDMISESHPKNPINPYGKSKLIIENILEDLCSATGLNATCLRYFNAAGAHESGDIGESHDPETHLIPNVLNSVFKKHGALKVFGKDYETPDGTCIRDYVHVTDLAQAHLKCMDYMKKTSGFSAFNLGNDDGFSVLEVIEACKKVTGKEVDYKFCDRRLGDPAVLVADSKKARLLLDWKPRFKSIDSIISSAFKWHQKRINQF